MASGEIKTLRPSSQVPVCDAAVYFSKIPLRPQVTAIARSHPQERLCIRREFQMPILSPAHPVMAQLVKALERFPVWEDCRSTT